MDTIAMVKLTDLAQRQTGDGFSLNIGALANPFRTLDAWVALADGRVATIRSHPYSVEWVVPGGQRIRGPAIQYSRVPVTAGDRAMIQREGVSLGGRAVPVPSDLLTDLPPFKPAFDARTVVADPTGAVWVQRFRAATDTVPVYDVFDVRGTLTSRVRMPARDRVVAVSEKHVYVARVDADGLHWLRRHAR